jgi:hypothetical protein
MNNTHIDTYRPIFETVHEFYNIEDLTSPSPSLTIELSMQYIINPTSIGR